MSRTITSRACALITTAVLLAMSFGGPDATASGAGARVTPADSRGVSESDSRTDAKRAIAGPCRKIPRRADKEAPGAVLAKCLVAGLVNSSPVQRVTKGEQAGTVRYDYRAGMRVYADLRSGDKLLVLPKEGWAATPAVAGGRWRKAVKDSSDPDEMVAYGLVSAFRVVGDPRSLYRLYEACPSVRGRGLHEEGLLVECSAPFTVEILGIPATVERWEITFDPVTMLPRKARQRVTMGGFSASGTERYSRWGQPFDFRAIRAKVVKQAGH